MPLEFNESELLDRVDDDIEFLEETIEILDDDFPAQFQAIVHAAATRDAPSLITPAHTVKGMVANFCAGPAEAAAREIEMKARSNQLEGIDANVQQLADETDKLREALHRFLREKQS